MPPIKQGTRAHVQLLPQLGMDGGRLWLVVIKERFYAEAQGRATRLVRIGGAQTVMADEPWDPDSPATSSIRIPSDICLRKVSTDVIVSGNAMSEGMRRVRELDVWLKVGDIERALHVTGTRVWYRGATGLALTAPEPFDEVPLRWELAWGGAEGGGGGGGAGGGEGGGTGGGESGGRRIEEARNPAGRGVVRDAAKLLHALGPQIEDPREPITSPRGRYVPMGVGAIGRSWMPRRQFAGTVDDRWMKERMPLPPADFDERFNQVAPYEQISREPLRGGERVQILNMCADGALQFELPRLHFFVGARAGATLSEHRSMLDTVLLQPNDRRVELTWRATIPVPRPASRVDYVQVHEKELRT